MELYLESPLNVDVDIMPPSEVEKIFRAFAEERKRELPQFTPDGIPITLENKFEDTIYNYLYEYWKTNSGEYDPKKDVIPESENHAGCILSARRKQRWHLTALLQRTVPSLFSGNSIPPAASGSPYPGGGKRSVCGSGAPGYCRCCSRQRNTFPGMRHPQGRFSVLIPG